MSTTPFVVRVLVPGRAPKTITLPGDSRVTELKGYLRDDPDSADLASKIFQRNGEVLDDTSALADNDTLTTKTKAEGGLL